MVTMEVGGGAHHYHQLFVSTHLLSTYYVPGSVPGTGNAGMDTIPTFIFY